MRLCIFAPYTVANLFRLSTRHGANYLSNLSLARTCGEGSAPPARGCFILSAPSRRYTASIGATVHVIIKRPFQV